MTSSGPSMTTSPQGRRVLVAVVTGEAGERIQRWRECHDPEQARRIPPHATLCYWVSGLDLDVLGEQVRHAFPASLPLRLSASKQFGDPQGTFYVPVEDTTELDAARLRLYDRTFVDLGELQPWPWHITCVRDSRGRHLQALREAARALDAGTEWRLDLVQCLELRGAAYEPVGTWQLP